MKAFSYMTSATYLRRDGSSCPVYISASNWHEAERMVAGLLDATGAPVRVVGHELDAPSWNQPEPADSTPRVRHLTLVPASEAP